MQNSGKPQDNAPLAVKFQPTTKSEEIAWCLYDSAKTAFEYITIETIYPVFLTYLVFTSGSNYPNVSQSTSLPDFSTFTPGWFKAGSCTDQANCVIPWMSTYIRPASYVVNIVSISVTLYIVLLFLLNSVVENSKYRKSVFLFFALMGGFSTCLAVIPDTGNFVGYKLTTAYVVISTVFWSISSAIYNSYLPIFVQSDPSLQFLLNQESSSPSINGLSKIHRMNERITDRFSSIGNSAGYAASIIIAGVTILIGRYLVVPKTYTAGLLVSGCWWLLLTIPAAIFLTSRPGVSLPPKTNCIAIGSAAKIPKTFYFLVLYFFFYNGASAVTYLGLSIAHNELKYSPTIFLAGLIIDPLFKILGNFFFYLVKRWFNIRSKTLLIVLVLGYILVSGYGVLGLTNMPFGLKSHNVYIISNCISYTQNNVTYLTGGDSCLYIPYEYFGYIAVTSILLGSIRTTSRTIFSQLIPKGLGFIFFGLLEVVGKGSTFIGPLAIGALNVKFGTYRGGFIYLLIMFVLPLPFLFKLDVLQGRLDSERFAKELEESVKRPSETSVPIENLRKESADELNVLQIQKTLKINSPFDFDSAMEVTPDD